MLLLRSRLLHSEESEPRERPPYIDFRDWLDLLSSHAWVTHLEMIQSRCRFRLLEVVSTARITENNYQCTHSTPAMVFTVFEAALIPYHHSGTQSMLAIRVRPDWCMSCGSDCLPFLWCCTAKHSLCTARLVNGMVAFSTVWHKVDGMAFEACFFSTDFGDDQARLTVPL